MPINYHYHRPRKLLPEWVDSRLQPFLDTWQIKYLVDRLGNQANRHYCSILEPGEYVVVVGVLDGAFLFMADLLKRLRFPTIIGTVKSSSYSGDKKVREPVVLTDGMPNRSAVRGRKILLVDTMIDSGSTVRVVTKVLENYFEPEEILTCALLKKKHAKLNKSVSFLGRTCPSRFVIGYGLDYNGLYRSFQTLWFLSNRVGEKVEYSR